MSPLRVDIGVWRCRFSWIEENRTIGGKILRPRAQNADMTNKKTRNRNPGHTGGRQAPVLNLIESFRSKQTSVVAYLVKSRVTHGNKKSHFTFMNGTFTFLTTSVCFRAPTNSTNHRRVSPSHDQVVKTTV